MSHRLAVPPRAELVDRLRTRSGREVAEMYGVSITTVFKWCASYGFTAKAIRPYVVPEHIKSDCPPKDELAGMLATRTLDSVGREFSVTRQRVQQWAQDYGFNVKDVRPMKEPRRCGWCWAILEKGGVTYCNDQCTKRAHRDQMKHGTPTAYSHWKCRCETCRTAHNKRCREYMKERRRNRKQGDGNGGR